MLPVILALVGAGVIGLALGYYLRYIHALSKNAGIELEIKEKLLGAEEKALKLMEKAEAKIETLVKEKKEEFKEKEEKVEKTEDRLIKKEELLDQRQIDIDSETEAARGKVEKIKEINDRLNEREESIESKYEEIAKITQEEAYEQVLVDMKKEREKDLVGVCRNLTERAKNNSIKKLKTSLPLQFTELETP